MLWGSSLAAGAEAFRRSPDRDQAMGMAINATRLLLESFSYRTGSLDCLEITDCDWSSKRSMAGYLFSGRFISCFNLADEWATEALLSATEGLSLYENHLPQPLINCASEVAAKMGASDEERVMVAGFAGGLGLSGNACGALCAAIWMNTLAWCREHTWRSAFKNPAARDTLKAFNDATGSGFLCREITGQEFRTIDDHTEFIRSGGCDRLINVLAGS